MKSKYHLYLIYAVSAIAICWTLGWNPLSWVGDFITETVNHLNEVAPLLCLYYLWGMNREKEEKEESK